MLETRTGEVAGAEALIRWKHPQQGMVLPRQFIPVAEQLGMITPITDWVLTSALREGNQWSRNGRPVMISVNLSAQSFRSPVLIDTVRRALSETGVDGRRLEIEITEDTLMSDMEGGAGILARLSELGVTIAIDDFGSGYSSLAYLRQLPINTIKIDQSFLEKLETDQRDAAVVRSIIELGHNLGCKVVAEGVERADVLQHLVELGCDQVQGYHVGLPMSQENFRSWLSQSRH
jgi:EAL domain-containing protein (putative c-di-GMP-specific phosphodiesterase class I)